MKHKSWAKGEPLPTESPPVDEDKNDVVFNPHITKSTWDELRVRGRTGDQLNNGEKKNKKKKKKKNRSRPFTTNLLTNLTTLQSAPKSNPLEVQAHISIPSKTSE